jgi:transposase
MQTTTTIGLDIAKSVFQVHGVDAAGQVVIRRQLKRRYVLSFFQKLPQCLVGIEACASVAPLVARAASTWSYGTADASGLRQTLCQTAEE